MRVKFIFLFVSFLLSALFCRSQSVSIGQWRDYLSYQQGLTVCQGGNNIYCCCSSGVFSYNLSDNSLERYNKVTGLSDVGCTVARYNNATNTLVIGYSDGNIDLMTGNQVINISDLKNSSVQGVKTINNIYFSNNLAYISCGQGVMVVDLTQDIILSLYYLGLNGIALNVYSTTIFNNTIFAATEHGIYKISVNDPNPGDFQDWKMISNSLPAGVYNGIVSCGNKMYASFAKHITSGVNFQDTLFVYKSGAWSYDTNIHDNIYSLESCAVNDISYAVYCGVYNATAIDTSGNIALHIYNYGFSNLPSPNDAILDNSMNLWIADAHYGLVKTSSNYTGQSYVPPGPYSNSAFYIQAEGPYLYIAPGGNDPTNDYGPLYISGIGISAYETGSWYRLLNNVTDTMFDLCCLGVEPKNPLHFCVGSWGSGVIEYNDNTVTNVYNPSNSPLENYYEASFYTVRVGGVAFDTNGNLWVTNSNVFSNYLLVRHTDGTWQSFDFSGISNVPLGGATATQLLITQSGAKWIIFPNTGILAYQDNGTFAAPNASNSVFITNAAGNGNLPSLVTYCMTQDLNGAIWIGNNTQVVVFYSPDEVFNGPGGWDAQNVYVQQNGFTQYLMQDQYSTCIAVDGANRKWIGTLGGGVFLMSADGTQQIYNFTSSNSPLLSNNILSITINQLSGEVFFSTDQGVVSYQGDATGGTSSFSNVYAYPDPVPHGYTGPIAIKNLVTNSDVKIATVSGEIVYHTIALGGQAVWYGTNFNGERVQTGVYLVFCVSPDGKQSLVTKLLFIN